MKRAILFTNSFLFLFSICVNAQMNNAQIDYQLYMKYWNYRYRFLGDDIDREKYSGFIAVGDGSGFSIPAHGRDRDFNSWDAWIFNPDPGNTGNNNDPGPCYSPIFWPPDNGYIKYYGVIHHGDNPLIEMGRYLGVLATEWKLLNMASQSTHETEYELWYAMRALDRLDEYGETIYGETPVKNGLLARNDVQPDFALNGYFGPDFTLVDAPAACTQADDSFDQCTGTDAIKMPNVMSEDEVFGLLVGLRLVAFCIPATLNGLSLEAIDVRDRAVDLTDLILSRLKDDNWMIRDPTTDHNEVCRGTDLQAFSFPFAKAGEEITGINYQNFYSSTVGSVEWLWLENNYIPTGGLGENDDMILKLAAISGTWPQLYLGFVSSSYNMEIFDLLGAFLYDNNPYHSYEYWLTQLDYFPCLNPYDYSAEGDDGLNYMLQYNLFRLLFHNTGYISLIARTFSGEFPMTIPVLDHNLNVNYIDIGSTDYPLTLRACDSWYLDCKINEHANVTFLAGNTIEHGPNYDFTATSDYFEDEEYQDFECIPNVFDYDGNTIVSMRTLPGNHMSTTSNYPNVAIPQPPFLPSVNEIFIFPNPASNSVNITVYNNENYGAKFIDSYGRICLTLNFTGPTALIDISKLIPGFYWLDVSGSNGKTRTQIAGHESRSRGKC